MSIAASKLGRIIEDCWSSEHDFVRAVRASGLVKAEAADRDLAAALAAARQEHEDFPAAERMFNAPHERARVFLGPYLSEKGQQWAVPHDSLQIPDDPQPWVDPPRGGTHSASPVARSKPWWRFW